MSSPQHKYEAGTRFTSCHIEQGVQVCKMTKAEGADWIAPVLVIAALVAAVFISGWILFSPAPTAKTAAARAAKRLSIATTFLPWVLVEILLFILKYAMLGVIIAIAVPMLALLLWIEPFTKSDTSKG